MRLLMNGVRCSPRTFKMEGISTLLGRRSCSYPVTTRAKDNENGSGGLDVAVFRFTLGIPGFDDALIPRVAGCVGAVLLLLNRLLERTPTPAAQERSEIIGLFLATIAFLAPTIEQRLKELQPGRGRAAATGVLEGAANCFAIRHSLTENAKREIAWTSFSLLKNANTCAVGIVHNGECVAVRGLVGATIAAKGGGESLHSATQSLGNIDLKGGYYPDRNSLRSVFKNCQFVPQGCQSAFVECISSNSWLILLCEKERALNEKEKQWASALAKKLKSIFSVR